MGCEVIRAARKWVKKRKMGWKTSWANRRRAREPLERASPCADRLSLHLKAWTTWRSGLVNMSPRRQVPARVRSACVHPFLPLLVGLVGPAWSLTQIVHVLPVGNSPLTATQPLKLVLETTENRCSWPVWTTVTSRSTAQVREFPYYDHPHGCTSYVTSYLRALHPKISERNPSSPNRHQASRRQHRSFVIESFSFAYRPITQTPVGTRPVPSWP